MIYLIHFDRPIGNLSNPHGQAQHYLGYTDNLDERLARHHEGRGAAIMAAVTQQGIGWRVVRTWEGDRATEKALKRRKNHRQLCPICSPKKGVKHQ